MKITSPFSIIGRVAAKDIRALIRRALKKGKVDETLLSFVAVFAAAGLAIGLALQGALSNFAAGFLKVIFKPFKVGDFIEGGNVAGVVEEFGIFTTDSKASPRMERLMSHCAARGGMDFLPQRHKAT